MFTIGVKLAYGALARVLRNLVFVSVICVVVLGAERPALSEGGDLLWEVEGPEGGFAATVAADAKQVFVGGAADGDGLVRSYDRKTGSVVWEDAVGGGAVLATAVRKGRLYTAGQIGQDGTSVWNVRAYKAKAGELLWQDQFNLESFPAEARAVAVKKQKVFAAGAVVPEDGRSDWFVRAYDRNSGAVLWEDEVDSSGQQQEGRAIAVRGHVVFVAGGSSANGSWVVRAYSSGNGQLLWEDVLGSAAANVARSIAVSRRGVFAAGKANASFAENDWLVRAYDRQTGALMWEDSLDAGSNNGAYGVAAKGSRVFAAGGAVNEGHNTWLVRAYNAKDGSVVWQDQFSVNTGVGALAIVMKGNRLFVGGCSETSGSCNRGIVRSYRAKDGVLLWEDVFSYNPDGDAEPNGMAVLGNRLFAAGGAIPLHNASFEWFVRAYQAK